MKAVFLKNPQSSSKHTHLSLHVLWSLHSHPKSVKMLTSVSQSKSDSSEVRGQTPVDQSRTKVLPLTAEMFFLVKEWVLCCLPYNDMAACLDLRRRIISAAEKLLVIQALHSFCLLTENISSAVTYFSPGNFTCMVKVWKFL